MSFHSGGCNFGWIDCTHQATEAIATALACAWDAGPGISGWSQDNFCAIATLAWRPKALSCYWACTTLYIQLKAAWWAALTWSLHGVVT